MYQRVLTPYLISMKKVLGVIVISLVVVAIGFYVSTQDAIAPEDGVATFTSKTLGIRFQYVIEPYEGATLKVQEMGNKVYLVVGDAGIETGQSIEMFAKRADETFGTSIRRQILAEYPSNQCKIEVAPSNILGGYEVAEITYPRSDDNEEPWFSNYELCNPRYDQTNGLRYFLYNPKFPDRFAFVSIGQYAILGHDNIPWQDTLEFIKK